MTSTNYQGVPASQEIRFGDFIRVSEGVDAFNRAGKDGMVIERFSTGVALAFGYDRYNRDQHCISVGPEFFKFGELDIASLEH